MKKIMKSGVLLLITAVLLALAACGSGKSEKSTSNSNEEIKTIKIGYLPITHAVPLYIEKEQAKYKNINLELVKFGSWPELVDALNTGNIDGASMLVTLAMKAKEQGIDLKAVALGHRDGNVIVVGNDISSVEDLKGKNFAIPHKFSTHNILLNQMLKQNNLKYSDVKVIELPPAEMPAALAEGRISGYVVAEPFGAASVALKNGKVLYQDQDIWKNSIDCALVLRGDFIDKERKAAQELVNYYVQAGKAAEQKDEQTLEMSGKYMKADKKVLDLSFQWIVYDDLKIHEADYKELTNNLTEMELQENPPAFKDFVDNSLFDKANGK